LALPFDFEVARRHCQGLRTLIILNSGGARDDAILEKLRARRHAAMACMDDEQCRQHLNNVGRYARDLFSAEGHRPWAQAGISGPAVLRLQILGELDACLRRLVELESHQSSHTNAPDDGSQEQQGPPA
jgi:hypothetical protein